MMEGVAASSDSTGECPPLPDSVPVECPAEKVLYAKEGVFVHVKKEDSEEVQVPGRLRLVLKDDAAVVEWQPCNMDYETDEDHGWAVITPTPGADKNSGNATSRKPAYSEHAIKFSLADLQSIERARADLGFQSLIFKLRDNQQLAPLHFNGTPVTDFWQCLGRFITLTRSTAHSSVYEVTDGKDGAFEMASDGHFASGISNLFSEESLYAGFSKVTRFVRHWGSEVGLPAVDPKKGLLLAPSAPKTTGATSGAASPTSPRDESGFEVLEGAEISRLPPWNEPVSREQPIDLDEWQQFLDCDGRVLREKDFRQRLFKGGLDNALRHHVWKFLLRFHEYDSDTSKQEQVSSQRRQDYSVMQQQWKSLLPSQMKRFALLRDRRHLIRKDVLRTDRTHPRFADDDSIYLTRLNDILTTYCLYNFDLGYVQGMSDLCAPLVDIMEDEVESFWCFAGFLDKVEGNFSEDQESMRKQLSILQAMLKLADPQLSDYLAAQDSDNLYFCFRWLLVLFKRELDFDATMRLWEVFWSDHLTTQFHLFFALALLIHAKPTILARKMDFNDIIKYVNELSGNIDLDAILVQAEVLCRRFLAGRLYLPEELASTLLYEDEMTTTQKVLLTESLEQNSVVCTADGSSVMSAANP